MSKSEKKSREDLELRVEELEDQISILRNMSGDFRDIQPGSHEWRLYKEFLPEAEEAMDKWLVGSILVYGAALTPIEQQIIERNHREISYCTVNPTPPELTFDAFNTVIKTAVETNVDHIYMKGFPNGIVAAINYQASFFHWRFRAKNSYVPS